MRMAGILLSFGVDIYGSIVLAMVETDFLIYFLILVAKNFSVIFGAIYDLNNACSRYDYAF